MGKTQKVSRRGTAKPKVQMPRISVREEGNLCNTGDQSRGVFAGQRGTLVGGRLILRTSIKYKKDELVTSVRWWLQQGRIASYFGAASFGDPLYAAAAPPDGGYWPLITRRQRT